MAMQFIRRVVLYFFLWLIVSPSIFLLALNGHRCFEPGWSPELPDNPFLCVFEMAAMGPIGMVFGGLAHDEQPPVNVFWNAVALAFCLGLASALLRGLVPSIIKRFRASP